MQIHWYGHSCFLLTAENGTRILLDPFDDDIGYSLGKVEADIVTCSHGHHDHNYLDAVLGEPIALLDAGTEIINGIRITGIPSFHDEEGGKLRGNNLIFLFEMDGLRLAHLGDIGDIPSQEALDTMGNLDILFAPVGGIYTIGPRTACDIANLTQTNVLIPMHYQTPKLKLGKPILGVDPLLSVARNCSIHKLNQSDCTMTPESLGTDRLLVLMPSAEQPNAEAEA